MKDTLSASAIVLSTVSFVHGLSSSAGACGPTSVSTIPGCWGTPGCAYVIANDLGSAARCSQDYCNCGGVVVPLLPETVSGTQTFGCDAYTIQPSLNSCPSGTAASSDTTSGHGPSSVTAHTTASSFSSIASTTPSASYVTEQSGGQTLTLTYAPTTYTQFASLSNTVTTTVTGAADSVITITVGPSGVVWTLLSSASGDPNVPSSTQPIGSSAASTSDQPTQPVQTVVSTTVGSEVFHETFSLITLPGYTSLSSTATITTTLISQSSPTTILVGPGGVAWTILGPSSGAPIVNAPTVLPVGTTSTTLVQASLSSSTIVSSGVSSTTADSTQASFTAAFADPDLTRTTITVGSVTEYWSKATFTDLSTITALTTVTTPVALTNHDGSHFTVSSAIIVVGSGGVWWKGGPGSLGLTGPSCIWPFCPPGPPGGGDIGGSGSGHNSADPGTPGSTEGTDDNDSGNDSNNSNNGGGSDSNQSQSPTDSDPSSTITSAASTTSSSTSSCSASTIASDCSAICSTAISASTLTCSTTCYSTLTGCSATGSTTTSTISACLKLTGWENVSDGNDFSYPPTTDTAGIASSTVGISASASTTTTLTTSASSGSHTSTLVTSTISSPKCTADGAAWFSPTSWCKCAPGATFSTISHAASATSAMCSYTSLPSLTIQPVQTSAAPTNIPGQGGVDGCVPVEATIGTSAYCNCGGTPAPTLSPKTSGLIDCQYTLQPTSSYDPAIPWPSASSSSLPSLPYATGTCTVLVDHQSDQDLTNGSLILSAQISDAENKVIGSAVSTLLWLETFAVDSLLPYVLDIRPLPEQNEDPLDFPVIFAYGAQEWLSDSPQCTYFSTAAVDASGQEIVPSYQVNCTFSCPAPSNLRRAAADLVALGTWSDDHATQSSDRSSMLVDHSVGNLALSTRTTRSALWTKYAPKGAALYKTWQNKQGDDIYPPCDFVNDFVTTVPKVERRVRPGSTIRSYLQNEGYDVGKEYYAIGATSPQFGAELVNFQNAMSATQGVFLANDNDRGARPADPSSSRWLIDFPNGRDPVEWQVSQVAWWMWKRTVALDYENTHGNVGQPTDFSKIRSFWRRDIRNDDTRDLLLEAFAGQDTASILTWTPDDLDQDSNPFWALLGSPNGNGIQWFLIDNKVALHGKGIAKISAVMIHDEGTFTMWATFTP